VFFYIELYLHDGIFNQWSSGINKTIERISNMKTCLFFVTGQTNLGYLFYEGKQKTKERYLPSYNMYEECFV
jgi:hypothetical protein